MPNLYLIPSLLSEKGKTHIPPIVTTTIGGLDVFIVEGLRTARRFIRKMIPDYNIDGATFIEMDKHNPSVTDEEVKLLLKSRKNIGLLSEAGAPCLADPGHRMVDMARRLNYKIVPLSGPTSIVLALIASGSNGQQFTFHGYLPVKENELIKKLKNLESNYLKTGYTQLWIETPYRNDKHLKTITKVLAPHTNLTVACDLTAPSEEILKLKIKDWRGRVIGKRPAIYVLG